MKGQKSSRRGDRKGENANNIITSEACRSLPKATTNQKDAPHGFTWVLVPNNQATSGMFNVLSGFPHDVFPPNWGYVQSKSTPGMGGIEGQGNDKDRNSLASGSSSIKEESLKKRIRRAKTREIEEVATNRVVVGKKPYAV